MGVERWVVIDEFPNYEVSDHGRIRNSKTGRILRTSVTYKGYEIVTLTRGGTQRTVKVHKLVADAFCEKYYDDMDATHLDGNRLNNRADNLDWWTRRDVQRRSYRIHGRRQIHRMRAVRLVETGEVFESIGEASAALGISKGAISRALNRRSMSTKEGYHFEEVYWPGFREF